MAHRFVISKELVDRVKEMVDELQTAGVKIDALVTDVRSEIEAEREEYDQTTDRWGESSRGEDVDTWIQGWETLAENLEALSEQLDSVTGEMDEITAKPES